MARRGAGIEAGTPGRSHPALRARAGARGARRPPGPDGNAGERSPAVRASAAAQGAERSRMTAAIPRDADDDEVAWMEKWQARSGCPPPDLLLPAVDSMLPDPLGAAVRAHVAACRLCTELVAVLAETSTELSDVESRRIDGRVRGQTRGGRGWWRTSIAAAAAVVAVAGAAYIARM